MKLHPYNKMTQERFTHKQIRIFIVVSLILIFWFVIEWFWTSGITNIFHHPTIYLNSPNKYQESYLTETSSLPNIQNGSIKICDTFPDDDIHKLINFTDFRFTMLGDSCEDDLELLALIHSSPKAAERRESIRNTWGSKRMGLKVGFLVGISDIDTQNELEKEQALHGDIIQGNFVDSYKNLTYKHVMALKYSLQKCPTAKFMLKSDDDNFVNMPYLMAYLQFEFHNFEAHNLLFCSLMDGSPALRTQTKWKVSFQEFQEESYPPYCSGYSIMYSPDSIKLIYKEAQKSEYFWIDDAFVTGILAKRVNLKVTDVSRRMLSYEETNKILEANSTATTKYNGYFFGPPNVSIEKVYKLWTLTLSELEKYYNSITL